MSNQDQSTLATGTGVDRTLQATSVLETAKSIPEISRFLEALTAAGIDRELRVPEFKTLFAPANDGTTATLDEDTLRAHIATGKQTEADLRIAGQLKTLAGKTVPVSYKDGAGHFGGARIIRRDIPCVDGQIQVIERPAALG